MNPQNQTADGDLKAKLLKSGTIFTDIFGISRTWSLVASLFILVVLGLATWGVLRSAPPRSLTLSGGPKGSSLDSFANKYAVSMASDGIKVKVEGSFGSLENLERLRNPASGVDAAYVQGAVYENRNAEEIRKKSLANGDGNLVSLGVIAYQPLFIFYRSAAPYRTLSDFTGKRLSIGPVGSGANAVATAMLAANGIAPGGPTQLLTGDPAEAAGALTKGDIDALFLMGDSASTETLKTLLRTPDVHLFSFEQADAYLRKFSGLNKLKLPEGGIDLGKDIPSRDIWLLGPTVELVARKNLNAALSDQLLDAAQATHGRSTLFQNRGEFPAPVEHDFAISEDAARYYKSGKSFFYRHCNFWIASLADQLVVVIIPTIVILLSGLKALYGAYKFQVQFRINRWYRILLRVERGRFSTTTREHREDLLKQVAIVEEGINRMKIPGSFVSQFYGLRQHIDYVRGLLSQESPT